ncbi:SIS domain-containing protein [Dichelobacter nodosus]|uniref:Phosphoheptose isomerase n=1 Tax=Dichelobacter nodosus (strain VCS1703A) TaxID=246195 RepID=A5EW92_DICNV|nr:D-sedoheptulose 7-phosphate isomerase [Dichelobacter nodosus]ABQ14346.1 phosphoheptose isomerase [Dichelobacter nodosus VCS1703A]
MNWQDTITAHQKVFDALREHEDVVVRIGRGLLAAIERGNTIFVAGNGGSAADAQHFAAELTGRFVRERKPLPGIALTTDTSALTAIANDYGYAQVFARQLDGLAQPGDVFVGISTSGNSPNVLTAVELARESGLVTYGLSGNDGGKLSTACDDCVVVPSSITAQIQEAHIFILHAWCILIDEHADLF